MAHSFVRSSLFPEELFVRCPWFAHIYKLGQLLVSHLPVVDRHRFSIQLPGVWLQSLMPDQQANAVELSTAVSQPITLS